MPKALEGNQVRVIALRDNEDSLRYNRDLGGMTVEAAIKQVAGWGKGSIPVTVLPPYLVNGEPVEANSQRILQPGDRLTVVDP